MSRAAWGTQPSVVLPPKTNVSPLIRGSRWVAFLFGVTYGYKRWYSLDAKEQIIQKREDAIKAKKAERAKVLHEKHIREHMLEIAKEVGHTPPKDF